MEKKRALESWALSSSQRGTLHPSYIIAWLTFEKFYSEVKLRSPKHSRIPTSLGMLPKQTGIYQLVHTPEYARTCACLLLDRFNSPAAPHNV
jgi:hypothetical protein